VRGTERPAQQINFSFAKDCNMTALAKATTLVPMVGPESNAPVLATTKILEGAMVGLTAAGYARPFVVGDKFVGHAMDTVDNTVGTSTASGAKTVPLLDGLYRLQVPLSSVGLTDPVRDGLVYAIDSGTLSLRYGMSVGKVLRYVSSGLAIVEFNTRPMIAVYAETIGVAAMTDGLGTSGYYDFVVPIPAGSLVLGWQANVTGGFSGDTTATVKVGTAASVGIFSAITTTSVLTVGIVSCDVLGTTASVLVNAATTVRVTVTGSADFTAIVTAAVGAMDMRILYIPTLAS
jgi:hypothetical protein